MEIESTFSKEISEMAKNISHNRERILDEFCKAYLASSMDKNTKVEELIKKVQLMEVWSEDRMKVSWHFEVGVRG